MNSIEYQKYCLTRPIQSSIIMGGIFSAISVLQGSRPTPFLIGTNMAGLYAFHIFQCPMEAIHGRQSSMHNAISGATLGFIGVRANVMSVPFMDATFFYRYPQISPPVAGALAYGAIGFLLAQNKPL